MPPEQYAALRATQVAEAKALGTVDEIRFEGLERTNPEVLRAAGREQARRAAVRREDRRRSAPHLRTRRLREHQLPHHRGHRPARDGHRADARSRGGRTICASALASRAISRATTRSTRSSSTARPGSTAWAASGLTEAQVGQNTHLSSEFYQPLNEAGRWFVAPNVLIGQQTRGVFAGDDKVADYLMRVGAGRASTPGRFSARGGS